MLPTKGLPQRFGTEESNFFLGLTLLTMIYLNLSFSCRARRKRFSQYRKDCRRCVVRMVRAVGWKSGLRCLLRSMLGFSWTQTKVVRLLVQSYLQRCNQWLLSSPDLTSNFLPHIEQTKTLMIGYFMQTVPGLSYLPNSSGRRTTLQWPTTMTSQSLSLPSQNAPAPSI